MPQRFLRPDRDQQFLLAPDMRDWLPADDLVWLVIEAGEQCGLSAFCAAYRADGQGRAAFDPALMAALLLYGYCQGVRSSRELERRCVRDVAFRVTAGGHRPDHATIAGSGPGTRPCWRRCSARSCGCARRPGWST